MNTNQVVQHEQKTVSNLAKYGLSTGLIMASAVASASTPSAPDLSPIVTMIGGLAAVVGSIGMAVLTVYATAKVFKWVKTAF